MKHPMYISGRMESLKEYVDVFCKESVGDSINKKIDSIMEDLKEENGKFTPQKVR